MTVDPGRRLRLEVHGDRVAAAGGLSSPAVKSSTTRRRRLQPVRPAEESSGVEAAVVGVRRGGPRRRRRRTSLLVGTPGHRFAIPATERVDAGQRVAQHGRLPFDQLRAQLGCREPVDRAADANPGAKLHHRGGALPAEELRRRAKMERRPADSIDEVRNRSVDEEQPDCGSVALNGRQKQRRKRVQVLDGV